MTHPWDYWFHFIVTWLIHRTHPGLIQMRHDSSIWLIQMWHDSSIWLIHMWHTDARTISILSSHFSTSIRTCVARGVAVWRIALQWYKYYIIHKSRILLSTYHELYHLKVTNSIIYIFRTLLCTYHKPRHLNITNSILYTSRTLSSNCHEHYRLNIKTSF